MSSLVLGQSTLHSAPIIQDSTVPTVPVKTYYQQILRQEGGEQLRYKAAIWTLEKYQNTKDEYSSYLYNLLAEEATIYQEWEQASCYYQKVIETNFDKGAFTDGLVAEEQKIIALKGMRNVAFQKGEYESALEYHEQYVDFCENGWQYVLQQNQMSDAIWSATCYQSMNKSEKAIKTLLPFVFGTSNSSGYSQIDKMAIDHLVELLQTKYPKRTYRKMLQQLANQINMEQREGVLYFYVQIVENRLYFPTDGARYPERVAEDEQLEGQAIAHYQRKLMHSYFYQALLKKS
jgi:hypothetical protein